MKDDHFESDSTLVRHEPCPECGSKDNLARYDDGHGYCFGCSHYEHGDNEQAPQKHKSHSKPAGLVQGQDFEKTVRGIRAETFKHWRYTVAETDDGFVHLANHYKDNRLIGQKVRGPGKSFKVNGKLDTLYGRWLWPDSMKRVVVTEGELDALSVSQVQGNKWPVVSVPNGAQGAAKAFRLSIEWLESFEEVVIMFDMDDPGQAAAEECAQLLTPGRAKIASLPLKDANEMVKAGRGDELIKCIWNANVYRPDGIVTLGQLKEIAMRPPEWGVSWPYPTLTQATYGRRPGDVITVGAGTGVGKTDFITECILWDLTHHDMTVGVLMLEQDPAETIKRVAGKWAGKRFHVPDAGWTPEELEAAIDHLQAHGKFYLYDSFGSTDWDTIKSRIRYLAVGCECQHIYLDHLTALAAHAEDERREIEEIMAELAGLAKELKVTLHVISHLATPDGKPHEEGGRVYIRHFKGSRAIGYWSYYMIALERETQAENEDERNTTTVRILKDRHTGQSTGLTFGLRYDHETGRLTETGENTGGFFDNESKEDIY